VETKRLAIDLEHQIPELGNVNPNREYSLASPSGSLLEKVPMGSSSSPITIHDVAPPSGNPMVHDPAGKPMLIKDAAPPSGTTTPGKARPSFLTKIKKILAYPASAISAPPFKCKLTEQAARENLSILAKHNYNTGAVIENSRFSPMSIGSEFKPAEVLEPLLGNLKSWPLLKKSLIFGAQCPQTTVEPDILQKKHCCA
jgi:hypothetical protein